MAFDKIEEGDFSCVRCKQKRKCIDFHLTHCKFSIENIDYVVCLICGDKKRRLPAHLKQKHGISKTNYEGLLFCSEAFDAVSRAIKITQKKYNFRNRLRAAGRLGQLEAYNKSVGVSVSNSVMANPIERQRRAMLLGKLNQTDGFRKRSSEAAKITSARADIILQRTERFYRLWETNPHMFYHSKPEKCLLAIVQTQIPTAKKSQVLKRNRWTNKSKRHQIDICDKNMRIAVEFDGPCHFQPLYGADNFAKKKIADSEVNSLGFDGYTVIRISHDQFHNRHQVFKDECLTALNLLLAAKNPGVFLLGEKYGKNNFLRTFRVQADL